MSSPTPGKCVICPRLADLPSPPPGKTGWPWTEESDRLADATDKGQQRPRISVITPSFNQCQFIEKTIRSILLQGYCNLELIIIDGGSTDGAVEIIQRYAPWLTYWISEKDNGQSHAINKGMSRATGEILAWLNSDDMYLPGTLSKVARTLTKPLSIVVGATLISEAGRKDEELIFKNPSYDEMLFAGKLIPQPSTFWTADLWREAGPLKENRHYVMDYDLWLRMFFRARNVEYHRAPLSLCHNHPDQKTQAHNYRQIDREKFLSVVDNLEFLELTSLSYFWRKWLYSRRRRKGLYRLLPIPRPSEMATLIYSVSRKAAVSWVSRS